jgi:uncharacterized membrane protein
MTWRATSSGKDRLWAALSYLYPLVSSTPIALSGLTLVPQLVPVLAPVLTVGVLIDQIPYLSFMIFLALFLLVVRNPRVHYFIRFNTMQAMLVGIVISLYLVCQVLFVAVPGVDFRSVFRVLDSVVFLGAFAIVCYGIVQCLRGIYPEVPTISDAAKSQLG